MRALMMAMAAIVALMGIAGLGGFDWASGERFRLGYSAMCSSDEECADQIPCTEDRCLNQCVHIPRDERCESSQCAIGECLGARGCRNTPVNEGGTCADDGADCTTDVCENGRCLHLPIDAQCLTNGCRAASCDPSRVFTNEDSCMVGEPLLEGAVCPDDGETCTIDFCRSDLCVHEPLADQEACRQVRPLHRLALATAAANRSLAAEIRVRARDGVTIPEAQLAKLATVAAALDDVARSLADNLARGTTCVSTRAKAAAKLKTAIPIVTAVKKKLLRARFIPPDDVPGLRSRGRQIVRDLRSLRHDLKALARMHARVPSGCR